MMTRTGIALCAILASGVIALATELPGYDSIERIIPRTTHVIVGVLISCRQTNQPNERVLQVTIRPERSLKGSFTNGLVTAVYREFKIPAIPKGMNVDFVNYTGSGIEWQAELDGHYIYFLQMRTNETQLLRIETTNEIITVRELFKEDTRKPQPSSAP